MSTTTLASRRFLVRPLDGGNQVYEGLAINATVRDLKERIFVAEGVAVENQKLIYGPEIMQDDRTLESYHIREGFVLRLLTVVQPPAPAPPSPSPAATNTADDANDRVLPTVFVLSANGVTVTMNQVRLRTTVKAFREQYSHRQAQDPEACRLIFSGKEMKNVLGENVMTLQDYNVQNESTLHEVFKVIGGLR